MSKKTIYTRPRRSMFDEYRDEIAECISQGMYTKDIADKLSEHFGYEITMSGLYYYIKHKMNLKINEMCEDIPRCNGCDKCGIIKDFSGRKTLLMCEMDSRIVSRTVHTSPSWCKKRGAVIES